MADVGSAGQEMRRARVAQEVRREAPAPDEPLRAAERVADTVAPEPHAALQARKTPSRRARA